MKNVRGVWDVAATVIVTGAALTMLGLYLHDRGRPASSGETFMPDWEKWNQSAIRLGPDDATLVIATFMDFTCPYCRDLVAVLDSVLIEFPGHAAVEFLHFPLENHEFALPSAVAAECAQRQDRFVEMYHVLFEQFDSIGNKAWSRFAADAAIPDIPAFEDCIRLSPDSFRRIAAGRALGDRIGVVGTPTVWVNGRLHTGRYVEAFRNNARNLGILDPR